VISLNFKKGDKEEYSKKFFKIQEHIKRGDFYLANLTLKTELLGELDLEQIYDNANAPFRLLKKGEFVCFSPERFVEIKEGKIYTYPMKGTSKNRDDFNALLNDKKEGAEHLMSVDLLRNDLSMVSKKVRVDRYRYGEMIKGSNGEFYQTSSKISGIVENNWQNRVGELLDKILPAGSITGTPKRIAVDSLKKIEGYDRGYFCGVAGVFDGTEVKSFVLIRFIEKIDGIYYYKSGGGITAMSELSSEYEEVYKKIYVPVF